LVILPIRAEPTDGPVRARAKLSAHRLPSGA
jgi:hypothetical protein